MKARIASLGFFIRKVFYICDMVYIYKPIMCKLQAIQFNGQNANEILDLIGKDNAFHSRTNGLWVFLPHGHKRVHTDDYVLLTEDKTIKIYDPIDFTKEFEPVP